MGTPLPGLWPFAPSSDGRAPEGSSAWTCAAIRLSVCQPLCPHQLGVRAQPLAERERCPGGLGLAPPGRTGRGWEAVLGALLSSLPLCPSL